MRGLVAALLAAFLTGCIPVCSHYRSATSFNSWTLGEGGDPMRQNVEKATDGFPVVGRSTREEVLRRLGEPDDGSQSGRIFVYRWRMVTGLVPLIGGGSWRTTYFLHIVFDEEGTVLSSTLESETH